MQLTLHKSPGVPRQTGAALLVFTSLLVLISASVLLDRLSNRVQVNTGRDQLSAAALAEAKAALISWSVGHSQEPGRLPWPDRNGDAVPNYDGNADCFAGGVTNALLLGRFPFAGDVVPCSVEAMGIQPIDGAKEPLFYAVSQNLIQHRGQPGADPPINPGLLDGGASYPWLTVRDQNGNVISNRVAAVVIAPGVALNGQSRCVLASDGTCANGNPVPAPSQYLDNVTVGGTNYDNSDNDLDFIQYPDSRMTTSETDAFNDRLVFITIDELMRKVEQRVLGDAAVTLQSYRTANGRYPWLSPYRDPTSNTAANTLTGRIESVNGGGDRIVDNEGAFPPDPALEDHVIINVTRRTFWTIKDQHDVDDLHLNENSDFQPGDAYNVRPAFNGIWGQREGHIPYIDVTNAENYAVATGFTLTWSGGTTAPVPSCTPITFPAWLTLTGLGCSQLQNSYQNGTFAHPQPTVPTPASSNGECIWTDVDTLDCYCSDTICTGGNTQTQNPAYNIQVCILGCGFFQGSLPVSRTYVYTLNYTGSGATTNVNNVKTRQVTNTGPVTIQMTDTLLGITLWSGTVTVGGGNYVVDGIYFDPQEGVEFPAYFFTNNWHQYVYVKSSDEHVAINDAGAGSSNNCTAGTDCLNLQIAGATNRNEVQAVVVGAGGQLTAQDRSNGNLSDYFENTNAATANDTAERGSMTAAFNDQVRVIRPNPP